MRTGIIFLQVSLCASLISAQQAPLSGPVEGFTFDLPTRSLRPVIGSLGSASLGQPLLNAAFGSVAPHQNYALTFQRDRCTLIEGLGSEQRSSVQIPGSFAFPEAVSWSGDGTTAILYSRTGNWLQVISGLPSAANPGPSLSLSLLGGQLSSVTTDLRGQHVVIGMVGAPGGVFQVKDGGTFVPLLSAVEPVAMALADDGTTLYAIDSTTSQMFEQNLTNLSSQSWPLDGLADPAALVSTKDAAHREVIYVAGRGDRLLKVFDSSTHAVLASIQLNFQPDVIQPLGSGSFLLGSRSIADDILWSFTNAPQPTVFFIPAAPLRLRENRRE
jgi:hypothetical protein